MENSNIVICGNKIDKAEDRKIGNEQAHRVATKFGLPYYEVSAKTDVNVAKMFYASIAELPFFNPFKNLDSDSLKSQQIALQLEEENCDSRRSDTTNSRTELKINGKVIATEVLSDATRRTNKCGC